jgi:hypothetical protein
MGKMNDKMNEQLNIFHLVDTFKSFSPVDGKPVVSGKLINGKGELFEASFFFEDIVEAVSDFNSSNENERVSLQPLQNDEDSEDEGNQEPDDFATVANVELANTETKTSDEDFDTGREEPVQPTIPSQTGSISASYLKRISDLHKRRKNIEDVHADVETAHFDEDDFAAINVSVGDAEEVANIVMLRNQTPDQRRHMVENSIEEVTRSADFTPEEGVASNG